MQRSTVTSSSLASIGYDALTRTLEIEFTNGRIYQYYDVPEEVHNTLLLAESLGQYFNEQIRDQYRYQQVK